LKKEGKQISGTENALYHMIYNNYYLTMSDLWILFIHFKIPVVFLSKEAIFSNPTKGMEYVFVLISKTYKYIINERIELNVEDFCKKSGIEFSNTTFYEYVFQN
jgi:hypothetical protein